MIMMPYGRCWSSLQLTGTQTSGTPQALLHSAPRHQHLAVLDDDRGGNRCGANYLLSQRRRPAARDTRRRRRDAGAASTALSPGRSTRCPATFATPRTSTDWPDRGHWGAVLAPRMICGYQDDPGTAANRPARLVLTGQPG